MEDASKAIWLAIGAMLFIAGLTTAIIMYTNMIKTVNTALSINDSKTNVVQEKGINNEIIYTRAELYYLINELSINRAKVCTSTCSIPSIPSGNTFSVIYTYEYDNSTDANDLNNHKISSIAITRKS